ncbi:MAG: 3-phosphoshikimate 1-carboxyvinyltransferase [Vampirovibrionales bacterium]|nr:3-phosphoshikimate 1-carboxyvinyltransferase [Vampirovibrionales bacterium]
MTAPSFLSTPSGSLQGRLRVPGDKSISHRVLMLAALSPKVSQITGLLPSADVGATAQCLRQLGATITWQPSQTVATVHGGLPWREPSNCLDAQNSGTTLRLLSGLITGAMSTLEGGGYVVLSGDDSLRTRPMGRVLLPLAHMGANVHGRAQNTLAPISILPTGGIIRGMTYALPVASAQVKSALLLAGLFASSPQQLIEPIFTRDHTERLLTYAGVPLSIEADWAARDEHDDTQSEDILSQELPIGQTLTIDNFDWEQFYEPSRCHWPDVWSVPGDISSAAFWMVAASLCPASEITLAHVGLNPSRTGLLDILLEAGADIAVDNAQELCGEPVADLTVKSASLSGDIVVDGASLPRLIDEIPILAVAAIWLNGTLTVSGAEELRKKESDRIRLIAELLHSVGVAVDVRDDGFLLQGNPDCVIHAPSGVITTHHDHRIAMAASILETVARSRGQLTGDDSPWTLDDSDCVAVSYPGFFEDLLSLTQAKRSVSS